MGVKLNQKEEKEKRGTKKQLLRLKVKTEKLDNIK